MNESIKVGDTTFTTDPDRDIVGHGMPGVGLVWHERSRSSTCPACIEEASKPATMKVTGVDVENGIITIDSI